MNNIAVDLDNVISETDIKVRKIIGEKYGINAKRQNVVDFNYEDCLPIIKEQAIDVLNELHTKHLLNLRLVPGARQALQAIGMCYKVIIATERPVETRDHTIQWLSNKHIPSQEVIFVKDKEELLAMHLIWFIDDRWENAVKIASNNIHVILFDRPWNRKGNCKGIHRARSWNEIINILGLEKILT